MIDEIFADNEQLLTESEDVTGLSRDVMTFSTNRITYIKRWVRRKNRDISVYVRRKAKLLAYMKSMMRAPNGAVTGQIMADDLYKSGQDCDVVEFIAESNYRFRPSKGNTFRYSVGSSSQSKYRGYIVHHSDKIKAIYCTCDDFYYRIHGHMFKAGLVFKQHPNNMSTKEHSLALPSRSRTNSDGELMLCKHLYAAVVELL